MMIGIIIHYYIHLLVWLRARRIIWNSICIMLGRCWAYITFNTVPCGNGERPHEISWEILWTQTSTPPPPKYTKTNMDDNVSMTHQYIVPLLTKIIAMYNITKAFQFLNTAYTVCLYLTMFLLDIGTDTVASTGTGISISMKLSFVFWRLYTNMNCFLLTTTV